MEFRTEMLPRGHPDQADLGRPDLVLVTVEAIFLTAHRSV